MKEQLKAILEEAVSSLDGAKSLSQLEELRVKFLGKKGDLTAVLRGMGKLSAEERPVIGQIANEVRETIESKIQTRKTELAEMELVEAQQKEKIDVTMPGNKNNHGHKHPISKVLDEMKEIFIGLGYEIAEGPEIELDYYCFEALNMPPHHPARDTQDTFYINDKVLLRTQTTSVQIRTLESQELPIKIVSPGRIYRSDEIDATHSPIFHQFEGLVVDKNVTMGDMIGTLKTFAENIFTEDTKIRLRPHHFPYTEPSAEVDVTCWVCGGKGCRVCKGEGWIELLGCGMVHPEVLENCGIDSSVYSGFAFGIGVERTAMGRYAIDDIRLLFENDVRFLKQF